MPFKDLLDSWGKLEKPQLTDQEYAVKLSVEDAARLHALADLHPEQDIEDIQGLLELLHLLERSLTEITGFAACSLLPAAGAQGE